MLPALIIVSGVLRAFDMEQKTIKLFVALPSKQSFVQNQRRGLRHDVRFAGWQMFAHG